MVDEDLISKFTASIDELSLSGPTSDILTQNGVYTIIDLLSLDKNNLFGITGFNYHMMAEIRALVQEYLIRLIGNYSTVEVSSAIRELKQNSIPPQIKSLPRVNRIETSPEQPTQSVKQLTHSEVSPYQLAMWSDIEPSSKKVEGSSKPQTHKAKLSEYHQENNRLSENKIDNIANEISLDTLVEILPLSIRARNSLRRNEIKTVKDLLDIPETEIMDIRNVGTKTFEEIQFVRVRLQSLFGQVVQPEKETKSSEVAIRPPSKTDYPLLKDSLDGFLREKPSHKNEDSALLNNSVTTLDLSVRTCNSLMRGGIRTIADLLKTPESEVSGVRNIGPTAIQEICIVRQHLTRLLDLTVDTEESKDISTTEVTGDNLDEFIINSNKSLATLLVSPSDYQFLIQMGVPLSQIDISRLALPDFLEGLLKKSNINIRTIDTLASQGEDWLRAILHINSDEYIRILTKSLKDYFAWLPTQSNWDDEITGKGISPLYFIWLKETTLEQIIDQLLNGISKERGRKIIRLRFGLDGKGPRTLEQAGYELDVTRERIRQIEKNSLDKLKMVPKSGLIEAIYTVIREEMEARGGFISIAQINEPIMDLTNIGEIDIDSAISLLLSLRPNLFVKMPKNRWGLKNAPLNLLVPITKQLTKILQVASAPLTQANLIARLLESELYPKNKIEDLVSTGFIEACLSTDDNFENTGDQEWGLTKWQKHRTDEIIKALRRLDKPSHFTEIAEVANSMLPPAQRASVRVYHAQLSNKPHLFVWVASGTFGLTEWGLKKSRFYVDIAEELLQKRGEPLTLDEIFSVVNAERPTSLKNINFMMSTNSRFCQYSNNKFGLASFGLASWAEGAEDESKNDDANDPFLDDLKRKLFDDFF